MYSATASWHFFSSRVARLLGTALPPRIFVVPRQAQRPNADFSSFFGFTDSNRSSRATEYACGGHGQFVCRKKSQRQPPLRLCAAVAFLFSARVCRFEHQRKRKKRKKRKEKKIRKNRKKKKGKRKKKERIKKDKEKWKKRRKNKNKKTIVKKAQKKRRRKKRKIKKKKKRKRKSKRKRKEKQKKEKENKKKEKKKEKEASKEYPPDGSKN